MVMPERHLERLQIMMSMSESPDLGALAMGAQHVQEATKEIARHLLAEGATLAYGGDLRKGGFTRLLFDMALTYNQAASSQSGRARIVNYLASTVWTKEGAKEQVELGIRRAYRGAARPICLPPPKEVKDKIRGALYGSDDPPEAAGLTDMRGRIIDDAQAMIFLGGQLAGYKGRYPGVLEEIALSLMADRPIYLLGGFGGATADAARAIFGTSPIAPSARRLNEDYRPDYREVMKVIGAREGELPANGLSPEENKALAAAVDIQTLIPLLLRGLRAVANERQDLPPERHKG